MVKWAIATLEWIYFDTEDKNNKDKAVETFPFDAGKKNPRIYYCYYHGQYIMKRTCSDISSEILSGGSMRFEISWYK